MCTLFLRAEKVFWVRRICQAASVWQAARINIVAPHPKVQGDRKALPALRREQRSTSARIPCPFLLLSRQRSTNFTKCVGTKLNRPVGRFKAFFCCLRLQGGALPCRASPLFMDSPPDCPYKFTPLAERPKGKGISPVATAVLCLVKFVEPFLCDNSKQQGIPAEVLR